MRNKKNLNIPKFTKSAQYVEQRDFIIYIYIYIYIYLCIFKTVLSIALLKKKESYLSTLVNISNEYNIELTLAKIM